MLVAAALAGACSDPLANRATIDNQFIGAVVFPLGSGTIAGPAAYDVAARSSVRPDGNLGFDFAFDLDAQGRVVILPQSRVGASLTGNRLVGLQRASRPWSEVTEAPRSGYLFDSLVTLQPRETFLVQLQPAQCIYSLGREQYAKFTVDSIVGPDRRMYLRGVINPNCGLRSFAEGLPKF